jgi:hypothetical protein
LPTCDVIGLRQQLRGCEDSNRSGVERRRQQRFDIELLLR